MCGTIPDSGTTLLAPRFLDPTAEMMMKQRQQQQQQQRSMELSRFFVCGSDEQQKQQPPHRCLDDGDLIIPFPPRIEEQQQQQQQFQFHHQQTTIATMLDNNAIIPLPHPPNISRPSQQATAFSAQEQQDNGCHFTGLPTDLFVGEDDTDGRNDVFKEDSMIVSPGNSRATWMMNAKDDPSMLWKTDASFTIAERRRSAHPHLRVTCPLPVAGPLPAPTPSLLLQPPPTTPTMTTPCGGGGGGGGGARGSALYGSFSSNSNHPHTPSAETINMWQYDEAAVASPRTTDAVRMMTPVVDWGVALSPSSSQIGQQQHHQDTRNNFAMMIPVMPSLKYSNTGGGGGYLVPPSLTHPPPPPTTALVNRTAAVAINMNGVPPFLPPIINRATYENDRIPSMISFVLRSPPFDFDVDDDVSLLADDPDDDDDNVLPNATYDVLANTGIFAEDDEA